MNHVIKQPFFHWDYMCQIIYQILVLINKNCKQIFYDVYDGAHITILNELNTNMLNNNIKLICAQTCLLLQSSWVLPAIKSKTGNRTN